MSFLKSRVAALLLCLLVLAGCSKPSNQKESVPSSSSQTQAEQGESTMSKPASYTQISAEEAKAMMDEQKDYLILDVRSQEEFDEGHIKDAIVIPDTEITERAEDELTDKAATILVYCRSGRRSKLAAQALADLGYTNIYEFGGILDWPYDTVK